MLIIGCGPAGLVLAAQLANFPGIHTVVVDRRDGPLEVGQADGVACRTVEIFEAFGLADRLVAEAYWVNEVSFWRPDPQDRSRITRTGRVQDVEDGLSEFPHVIVNQARMLAYLRDHMERSASRLRPCYGLQATDVRVDTERLGRIPSDGHPAARRGIPGDRADLDRPGEVRRRLRRRPQRCPDRDRPRAGRRPDEPVLGCHGRPGGHRLPRHPPQERHPLGESGQPADHPARGRVPDPVLHRAGPGARPGDAANRDGHPGEAGRGGQPDPAPVHARGERRRVVVGVRDRPAAVRQVR